MTWQGTVLCTKPGPARHFGQLQRLGAALCAAMLAGKLAALKS